MSPSFAIDTPKSSFPKIRMTIDSPYAEGSAETRMSRTLSGSRTENLPSWVEAVTLSFMLESTLSLVTNK